MGYFAVIDTETNWADQVMSIGAVIADCDTFCPVDVRYYVLTPEFEIGGMYENELFSQAEPDPILGSRQECLEDLYHWLGSYGVTNLYAYNASFDRNHLPEFSCFSRMHAQKLPRQNWTILILNKFLTSPCKKILKSFFCGCKLSPKRKFIQTLHAGDVL